MAGQTTTMMMMMTMTMMLLLMMLVDVGYSIPMGDRDVLHHTESPKVSELRHKLQRLHDILEDYQKHGSSAQEDRSQQHGDAKRTEKLAKDRAGSDDHNNNNDNNSDKVRNETANDTDNDNHARMLSPRETSLIHPRARAVSAEDMDPISPGRDADEEDLVQLAKTKSKRQGKDTIQILAKALAELQDEHPRNAGHSAGGVKGARADDAADVKLDRGDNLRGVSLETSLIDELSNLLDDGRQADQIENIQPLFHGTKQVEGPMKTTFDPSAYEKAYNPLGDHNALWQKDGDDSNDDDDDDNDDVNDNDDKNDVDDDADDELLTYLQDAGFSLDDLKKSAPITRAQLIEDLEERLMEDIQMANTAGVSVNDLIQDLEDKAFREALIRRLNRVLYSQ